MTTRKTFTIQSKVLGQFQKKGMAGQWRSQFPILSSSSKYKKEKEISLQNKRRVWYMDR